jgi:hypothetical protein
MYIAILSHILKTLSRGRPGFKGQKLFRLFPKAPEVATGPFLEIETKETILLFFISLILF